MQWIITAVKVVLEIVKALFGISKPATTEVENAKPDVPICDDDDVLLEQLGIKRLPRSDYRPTGGDADSDRASGEANAGDGKPEDQGSSA